ncbi:MAG: TonB-dependent siderophore receptor [Parvibaculum sp.]|uniref:TonB-dependent receptor n=1 Tax=Parvibaculum sp. TaxID=2024848 RepID=UPI003C70FEE9
MIEQDLAGNRTRATTSRCLFATTAIGLFIGITPLHAAEAGTEAAPAVAQEDGAAAELPAISVEGESGDEYKVDTASSPKFTAPLLDTPKSVTVVPEAVIRETGATTLTDALRTTPGITLGMGEGGVPFGDRFMIRGFNAESDTFVDGIRDPGSQTREIFDLEEVDVVKGPGSAFTGAGSTGGSINLVTKAPKGENFAAGSVVLGTDHTRRVTGDVNYVIDDSVALRLNAMYHDADVAGRDAIFINRWGFAPSIVFGRKGPTRVTLDYYHLQTDDLPDYGIPYNKVYTGAPGCTPTTTTCYDYTGAPADVDRDNFYGLVNRDFRKTQADIGTVRIEHYFSDDLTIRNTTRYSVTSNDYVVTNPDDNNNNVAWGMVWRNTKSRNSQTQNLTNQTDLTGRFATGFIGHEFATGVEFSHYETTNRPYTVTTGATVTGPRCLDYGLGAPYNCTDLQNPNPYDPWAGTIASSATLTTTKTTTQSIYALDTLTLTPQWLLNLGLRYDHYNVKQTTSPVSVNDGENDSGFLNYQAGVVYKPVANGSIYISYATSSNPSGETGGDGGSNLIATNINLDPEENVSYEIGTKWDVLKEKLSLTAAIFRTEKTNARVSLPDGSLQLVGEQRVNGFELGISGQITEKWRAFGGYTFLDATIVDDGTCATCVNDGNRFPNVPRSSISLWTAYDVTEDVTVGGGAQYVSKVYGNEANTLYVPAYWRFDAMAAYKLTSNVDLQLNVLNIFDKRYFDRAYRNHMATVAPGRSALLTTNIRF